MVVQQTLSIVKPDGVSKGYIGEIYSRIENSGLRIVAAKMLHLTRTEAEGFYAIHKDKPFFKGLVSFMTSGPVMIQVLEGDEAVIKYRDLMGATNPRDAAKGTIRGDLAESIDENLVHGSDSVANAKTEIEFFFTPEQICTNNQ
jgi:nucleoside-diphosphate kinase